MLSNMTERVFFLTNHYKLRIWCEGRFQCYTFTVVVALWVKNTNMNHHVFQFAELNFLVQEMKDVCQ